MKFIRFFHITAALLLSAGTALAQGQAPPTPEQQEKQLAEAIDQEVHRLSVMLNLEDWQEFYVDSTLNHDLRARTEELQALQKAKVENPDLYQTIHDKWMQAIDDSYKRFLTEEQWAKYWKVQGKRNQKEREKHKK